MCGWVCYLIGSDVGVMLLVKLWVMCLLVDDLYFGVCEWVWLVLCSDIVVVLL